VDNILIACDSFKGSLRADLVVSSIATGWMDVLNQSKIIQCPLADGGEGSLEAISQFIDAKRITVPAVDARGTKITTFYLWQESNNTAYIEMANIVGIEQLQKKMLNPLKTSSYGLGMVMKSAIEKKVSKIILFVGGSSTNDMGIGAAQALGINFKTSVIGNSLMAGEDLSLIEDYEQSDLPHNIEIIVATDVTNPLCGPQGASLTFGFQKGGKRKELIKMDKAMKMMAGIIQKKTRIDLHAIPGGGAAGGIAAGMVGFFNAKLVSGADLIFDLIGISEMIMASDLIITGEGKMDSQTLDGKLISKLSALTNGSNKPLIAVCGDIELAEEEQRKLGISDAYSLRKWTNNAPYSSESTILHLREIGAHLAKKYLDK
jgi:glycerate kinase